MIDGLAIVQKVYRRLRRPSDLALSYQHILDTIQEVIAQKKLDLSLSTQNSLAVTSDWFTVSSTDFSMEEQGLQDILLPIRAEYRASDSLLETGLSLPIVNYEVLNESRGAASFYGSPIRMALRENLETVSQYQFRVIYEPDFADEIDTHSQIDLPNFFVGMIADEATYKLINLVEDNSPDWLMFKKEQRADLALQIADWRVQWDEYVKKFKGRATVPKRTYPHGGYGRGRMRGGVKLFRGDY